MNQPIYNKLLTIVDTLEEPDKAQLSDFLKESREYLAASESRYRILIETMTEGLVCLDPLMKIIQVNQTLCRMLKYEEADLLGRSYLDIIDKPYVARALEQFWRNFHGERSSYETSLLTRTGQKLPVMVGAVPFIDDNGKVHGTFGIYTDISEQRRAEAEIRYQANLLANVHDCIITFDIAGKIMSWNRGAEKLYGWNQKEAIGQSINILYPSEEVSKWQEILTIVWEGKRWSGQIDTITRQKIIRTVSISLAPVRDENGSIGGAVGIVSDITHLVESRRQAEAENRAKSEFLANMSHEIRTPLVGILGFADLLAHENLSPRMMEYVTTIQRCGYQLSNLINDVLDFSKIEADRIILFSSDFEIKAVVDECVATVQSKLEDKAIQLRISISHQVPSIFKGDAVRIGQVLTNLLGNAVKFTEQGWIKIEVGKGKLKTKSSTRYPLLISVRDTGIGIPLSVQQRIFETFVQGDGSTTRKYGGSGLGLAISRQLVELMGGRIWVESKEGNGSTFNFCVPLEISAAKTINKGQTKTQLNPMALGNMPELLRILVVEDNEANQRLIVYMLKDAGYTAEIVRNGQDCLQILEKADFDLVLMDMQMPVMDGYQATRSIRRISKWQDLPIIALTAHAIKGDAEKCLEAGCNAYLAKPFTREQLLSIIRHAQHKRIKARADNQLRQDQIIQALIPEFLDDLEEMMVQIEKALGEGNLQLVLDISHDIKGSAGLYGLKIISDLGAELNQSIKQGEVTGLVKLKERMWAEVLKARQATLT